MFLPPVPRGGDLFGYIIRGRRREDEQEEDCPEFGSVHQLLWHIWHSLISFDLGPIGRPHARNALLSLGGPRTKGEFLAAGPRGAYRRGGADLIHFAKMTML